jgi:hypothetical protein
MTPLRKKLATFGVPTLFTLFTHFNNFVDWPKRKNKCDAIFFSWQLR